LDKNLFESKTRILAFVIESIAGLVNYREENLETKDSNTDEELAYILYC
jgi:hypothetical protein